jgi:hypothetical protein
LNLRYVEKERKKTKKTSNNDAMLIKQIITRKKSFSKIKFPSKNRELVTEFSFYQNFFFLQDGKNLPPKKALSSMGFLQIVKLPFCFWKAAIL